MALSLCCRECLCVITYKTLETVLIIITLGSRFISETISRKATAAIQREADGGLIHSGGRSLLASVIPSCSYFITVRSEYQRKMLSRTRNVLFVKENPPLGGRRISPAGALQSDAACRGACITEASTGRGSGGPRRRSRGCGRGAGSRAPPARRRSGNSQGRGR